MEETLSQEGEIISIPPTSEQLQEIIVNRDPPIPESAQNPSSTGSDGPDSEGESGFDSDSEDDAQQNLQLQTLEAELSSNPSNYEAHVQYIIRLLRKMRGIEKLRLAREAMSELFTLTPTMWREWAKDEASIDPGPEAVHAIEKLYERGVIDYLSVSLWCDYLSFVLKSDEMVCDCSSADISKARILFESALTAAGLHVAEGIKLWEAYREFEQAIFQTIDPSDIQVFGKSLQCTFSTIDKYLDLFVTQVDGLRRRLSFTAEVEDVLNYSLIRETFRMRRITCYNT